MARVLPFAIAALAGCYSPSVNNGELRCSITDKRCPVGFHCATDGTCWKNGQDPGTTPPDLGDSGGGNLTAGSPCSRNGQCMSGFCAPEGVCCNRACTGSCEACNLPGSAGTCSNVPAGGMPAGSHASCGPDAQSTCMRDGTCDGNGGCHLWSDVVCMPGSCDPGTNKATAPSKCDGMGTCVASNAVACDPYLCLPDNSACYTTCTAAVGCKPPNPCMSGSCGPKANGSPCSANGDCISNKCSPDGVCCDVACTGRCEACNVAPNIGTCTAVTSGQPRAGHGGNCAGFGDSSGCGGSCVSGNRLTCSFPGNGLPNLTCSAQSCADATTQRNAAQCDGAGACSVPTTSGCGGFKCVGTACLTSCSSITDDSPCAPGYFCNNPQCLTTRPPGRPCPGGNGDCTMGNCWDGYCCASDCSSKCYRCDSTPGTCTPTANLVAPVGGRAPCGTDPVCYGSCNGAGACANYPVAGTTCNTYLGTMMGWCKSDGSCGPSGCFVAGTPVRTADGLRPIETIAPGDQVYSFDVVGGGEHLRRVYKLQQRRAAALVNVALADGTSLVVTPEHYFWVRGAGWVRAGELTVADQLRGGDGSLVAIGALWSLAAPHGETMVYNLDVEGENTYFVGAAPVLVESCDYTNFSSLKTDELPR